MDKPSLIQLVAGITKADGQLVSRVEAKYFADDVWAYWQTLPTETRQQLLETAVNQFKSGMPLQYISQKAHFLSFEFLVNEAVLIPRPETEELVLNVVEICTMHQLSKVIDIGTGSGCIAVSVAKMTHGVQVFGLDVSSTALEVAKYNASKYQAEVSFLEADFLEESTWSTLPKVDLIVSNPPYISDVEKNDMEPNVLDFEPHLALFAQGHDPLIFYRKLHQFRLQYQAKAWLVCELNAALAEDILAIFAAEKATIHHDLQGKPRILVVEGAIR